MPDSPQEQVISNPTYMGNIRYFFEPEDIDHMSQEGFDFSTYAGVKKYALAIFAHTSPPNATCHPSRSANGPRSVRRRSKTGF